jgi:RNA methyltransferase, TrmH family
MITSTSNPRIQRARKLKRRADRESEDLFLIEGPMTLEAAARTGLEVREVFVDAEAAGLHGLCVDLGLQPTSVSAHVLRALADTSTPQGVVAVVARPSFTLADLKDPSLVVVLAEVGDPGNAGTLIRSASAAGADAVVFTEGSVDPYAPKTVRSSAGALFAVPIVRDVGLHQVISELVERGLEVYLAEAGEGPDLAEVNLATPVALVLGNEARGIPPQSDIGTKRISIPMPGGTESLNVAVAGSIILYETVRQRRDTRS